MNLHLNDRGFPDDIHCVEGGEWHLHTVGAGSDSNEEQEEDEAISEELESEQEEEDYKNQLLREPRDLQ